MQTRFSVLFYPRGNDIDKNGNAPIYLRITVDGKRSELSIKRKVLLTRWNSEGGKVRGTAAGVRELNRYIDTIKFKIYKIHDMLSENQELVTADIINSVRMLKKGGFVLCDDVFKHVKKSDEMYQSIASYETIKSLSNAKLINYSLVHKRIIKPYAAPKLRKYIAVLQK